jgi:hypothetical protein
MRLNCFQPAEEALDDVVFLVETDVVGCGSFRFRFSGMTTVARTASEGEVSWMEHRRSFWSFRKCCDEQTDLRKRGQWMRAPLYKMSQLSHTWQLARRETTQRKQRKEAT